MANILLLDDDRAHRHALGAALSIHYGYTVRTSPLWAVGSVLSELLAPDHPKPDLVVLDPFTAQIEGLSLVRMVRIGSGRPVIVAVGTGAEAVRVQALRAGADAVVDKAWSAEAMHALITAVLRRVPPLPAPGPSTVGDLSLDPGTRTATLRGRPLSLTRGEFDLLQCLVARQGRVVSRARLAAAGWGSVDVLLSRLRAKLGETARRPAYLHTYRGRGVAIRKPVGSVRIPAKS